MLNDKIKLRVTGKNITLFINKINKNNIDILDLTYINRKEIIIVINYKDYKKFMNIKTIYNYEIIDTYGKIKIKKILNINKYLILFLCLNLILICFLTNVIINVEITTDNKEMKQLLITEMKENGIYKYSIKKNYSEIIKIVEKIKNNNIDKIEWLDIKQVGTKYIVNFLERKKNKEETELNPRNVIAKKSGIIKKIVGSKGEIIESINNYVNKGDVIISGEIKNNEVVKDKISATGEVYAEVWYKVMVEFPLIENKSIKTDKFNKKINLKFINKYLIPSKYKDYIRKDKIIYKNILLPISIVINNDQKITKNDSLYLPEEATEKAYELGIKKINDILNENEYIILKKKLNYFIKDSTIELEIFFKVYENITEYKEIEDIVEE